MVFVWLTRKTYAGFGLWTGGNALFAAGFLLLSLRGTVPDFVTIVLANGLLTAAAAMYYEGTLRFRGATSRGILSMALVALTFLETFYFRFVVDSVGVRVIAISLLFSIMFGLAARALLRGAPSTQRASFRLTGCLFALCSAAMLTRGVVVAFKPGMSDLFGSDLVQTISLLMSLLLSIAWTFAFFILNGERLELELLDEMTERRQANEALRESEERFRRLFETLTEGVCQHELIRDGQGIPIDYRIIGINPAYTRLTGIAGKDAIGQAASALYGTGAAPYLDVYARVVTSGEPASFQTYFEPLKKHFEISVFATAGNGFATVFQDITAWRRTEQEMAVIAEIGRVISSTLDIDDVYERFAIEAKKLIPFDGIGVNLKNPGEETITIRYVSGIDIPERRRGDTVPLVGTFSAVVMETRSPLLHSAKTNDEFSRRYPDVPTSISLQAGVQSNMIIPLFSRDNVIGTLHFRAMKPDVYTEEDRSLAERIAAQIAGAMANAQLFKELQETEKVLRESEARFRDLLQNVPYVAVQGYGPDGTARYWNRASEELYGYTAEEAIGRNLVDLIIPPEMGAEVAGAVRHMAETGEPIPPSELSLLRKDGSRVAVFSSHAVVRRPGHEPELFCIDIDLTERKNLEERLKRAEKMEALGILAGGVAHDLNNVLGVVVGYAEMLLDEIDAASPAGHDVVQIMEGGTRAAAIVQDLLTLARRGVQTRTVVNLNDTILTCLKTPEFERILSLNSRVRVETDFEPNLLNITGSPVHLGKTLINLVLNAVEAMPGGGTVTIRTSNQYVDRPIHGYDQIREGDYVVLSVSDTGEGISANNITRIFEPFYTKKIMGRSGTGLGLAVVWGTVKDHDGYIDVRSQEGKGSIFTLYFPVTRDGVSGEQVSVSLADQLGKGESILVVDDVAGQRELAVRILTKLHYRVDSVPSGEMALEYLKNRPVDLIVLDMIMDPGMDGLTAYEKILEVRPKQKAVIVSGFSESERVGRAQELGAGPYVRKPYAMERLALAVRRELDRE